MLFLIAFVICFIGIVFGISSCAYVYADTVEGTSIEEISYVMTSTQTLPGNTDSINITNYVPEDVFKNEGNYYIGGNYSYAANVCNEDNHIITSLVLFDVISNW